MGISVTDTEVTLVHNCDFRETKAWRRPNTSLDNKGSIFLSRQLEDGLAFEGILQELIITSDPEDAFRVCDDFAPKCNVPLEKESINSTDRPDCNAVINWVTLFNTFL